MIRHIVFFSARDAGDLDRIEEGLSLLRRIGAEIAGVRRLEVARNRRIDSLSREVDIVVYGEFDDEAALERFKTHPLYEESIARVRPLRDLRIAADIQAD